MENGIDYRHRKPMKRAEKQMVWTYIYYDDLKYIQSKLDDIRSKGDRFTADAMIIIKGFSEEQLNNMRCRPKLDDAIAHIGILKIADMMYVTF